MSNTTAFEVITFPILGNMEIHVGKDQKGFFYEVQELTYQQIVDAKDSLDETLLFDCVAFLLKPSSVTDFFKLIHTL